MGEENEKAHDSRGRIRSSKIGAIKQNKNKRVDKRLQVIKLRYEGNKD